MSKLGTKDKFLDLSDYGRPIANYIAFKLRKSPLTPIHITLIFGACGLLAAYFILKESFILAGFFLVLKSIIDAIDGELARVKNTPSYTGRYLDSIFDIILNFIFLICIYQISESSLSLTLAAFFCIQLQGTLYNYYYVILRNKCVGADCTSKIFENKVPIALPGEKQVYVTFLYTIYIIVYGPFDKIIQLMDYEAHKIKTFPNWFMTFLSIYGLGFQLLLIAVMLIMNFSNHIMLFFVFYTVFLFVLIAIRKKYIHP